MTMTRRGRGYNYRLDSSLLLNRKKKRRIGRYLLLPVLLLTVGGAAYFFLYGSASSVDTESITSILPLPRKLEAVTFIHNGNTVKVQPDSQLSLNPADSLQLLKVQTDGWISWGVKAVSSDFDVNVLNDRPVTIKEIWPDDSFETPREVAIQFVRWKMPIGRIDLLIRLDARDWLHKANAAMDPNVKARYLENALKEHPGNTLVKTQLANVYLENKSYAKAAELYEDIAKSGKSRAILERQLIAYKAQNRVDAALQIQLELLNLSQDADDFKALLGYLQKNRSAQETANFLHRHQGEIPKQFNHSLLLYVADLRTQTKDWSDAAAAYERAIRAGARDPDIYYNLAVLYEKNNELGKAIDTLGKYLQKNPGDTKTWMHLAELQEQKGSPSQARATYEKILDKNPKQKEAILRLVSLAEQARDKKALISAYERLAALQPDSKTVQFNLGVLYYEAKDWEKASKAFKTVSSIDSKDVESRKYLLDLYRKQNNSKDEVKILRELAQLQPDNGGYYDALFKIYDDQKDYKAIVELCQKASGKNPDNAAFHRYLLYAHLKLDNIEGALKELEALIRLNPKDRKYLRQAANLYEKSGRYKDALQKLDQLLKLDPNDKESKQDYLRLRLKIL